MWSCIYDYSCGDYEHACMALLDAGCYSKSALHSKAILNDFFQTMMACQYGNGKQALRKFATYIAAHAKCISFVGFTAIFIVMCKQGTCTILKKSFHVIGAVNIA